MLIFNEAAFARQLLAAPPKEQIISEAQHSPYVQTLADRFKEEKIIALSEIDWNAFALENVTPVNYEKQYDKINQSWIQGLIDFCRKSPAFRTRERTFFLRCRYVWLAIRRRCAFLPAPDEVSAYAMPESCGTDLQ